MSITLNDGTTLLDLDPDLYWSDEDWSPVVSESDRSVTGAMIVHHGLKQAGRPITLQPEDDRSGQMTRALLRQLRAWEAMPGLVMALSLRGETFNVRFRHGTADGSPAVTSRPMVHYSDAADDDLYFVTVRFVTV